MNLSLTFEEKTHLSREEKDSVRVIYRNNCFLAAYGEDNRPFGKYFSCAEMLHDFQMSGVSKADFDPMAHYVYERGDFFLIHHLSVHKFPFFDTSEEAQTMAAD